MCCHSGVLCFSTDSFKLNMVAVGKCCSHFSRAVGSADFDYAIFMLALPLSVKCAFQARRKAQQVLTNHSPPSPNKRYWVNHTLYFGII